MSPLAQGLILLLATALISGLLVPLVINRVQARNQQRLKEFEGYVARQSKVIDDQVRFLERLADALWAYELMLIAPLYYGQSSLYRKQGDSGPYGAAVTKYFEHASDQLGVIRSEIGKAVRLVPEDMWNDLKNLYYRVLLPLDLAATDLLLDGPSESNHAEWSKLQQRVLTDLAIAIDQAIDRTAEVLSLKAMSAPVAEAA
jgi:hypothetical protein